MVHLDQYCRNHKPKRKNVVPATKRDSVIREVMNILSDWRSSPFELEGEVRTGLRQAFCLSGVSWPVADTEAASLVDAAFTQQRVVRPRFVEGHAKFVFHGFCYFCDSYLDGGSGSKRKFCSTECAKMALDQWKLETGKHNDIVYVAAYNALYRAKYIASSTSRRLTASIARNCDQCGAEFRVVSDKAPGRFCSKACRSDSLRTRSERACQHCGTTFLPSIMKVNKFCSRPCYQAARKEERHLRQCECCDRSFITKVSTARYCGKACISTMHQRRKKGKAVILPFPTISPVVFDREFAIAA